MKCPYQILVTHKPEHTVGYVIYPAEDITQFGECLNKECPFYYETEYKPARKVTPHCKRAESEEQ